MFVGKDNQEKLKEREIELEKEKEKEKDKKEKEKERQAKKWSIYISYILSIIYFVYPIFLFRLQLFQYCEWKVNECF